MKTVTELKPPAKRIDERACLFALAGLLHDVGKVFEPANVELGDAELRLEQMICPTQNGRSTHRHVLYTAYALHHIKSNFGGVDADRLFAIACNHHRPSSGVLDEHILTRADWLASGHDRRKDPTGKSSTVTGLASVLATIGREGGQPASKNAQLPTVPNRFDRDSIFPRTPQSMDEYRAACGKLGRNLLEALSRDWDNPKAAVEGVLAAERALLSGVPASRSWDEIPDVSLADHKAVVAAFAACLAMQHREGSLEVGQIKGRFRLVAINVGGIQRFIFRVMPEANTSETGEKGRAKRLRARSWLVSMLAHLAARRVLDTVGLPMTNCVLEAGGRALLLLPACDEVDRKLDEAVTFCRRWMHEHFAGTLRLDIGASETLENEHFSLERFGEVYKMAATLPDRARVCNGTSLWQADGEWNEDAWVGSTPGLPIDTGAWPDLLKELGTDLPQACAVSIDGRNDGESLWSHRLMGYRVALLDKPRGAGTVLRLNVPDQPAEPTLLNAGYVPREDKSPVTFNKLASRSVDDDGTPASMAMLGVLKADIDDLGYLISHGFTDSGRKDANDRATSDRPKASRVSLGRVAAFSRTLDGLFKAFLPNRLAQEYRNVYTIFCGGDDLLFVGPWLDIVRLAASVRRWLDQASAGNDELTISAGIALAKPGAPIRALAGAAETSLETAKDRGKNGVCIGPTLLSWPQLDEALQRHRLLFHLAEYEVIGRSLVYRLLLYARDAMRVAEAENGKESEQKLPLSCFKWRAQMHYDLRRNVRDAEDNPDMKEKIESFRAWLVGMKTQDGPVLHTACTLALYRLRQEES